MISYRSFHAVLCSLLYHALAHLCLPRSTTNESERDVNTVSVGAGEWPAHIRLSAADR